MAILSDPYKGLPRCILQKRNSGTISAMGVRMATTQNTLVVDLGSLRQRVEERIKAGSYASADGGFNNEVQRAIRAASGWDGVGSWKPHRQARIAQNALPPSHPRRTIPNLRPSRGRFFSASHRRQVETGPVYSQPRA